MRPAFVIDVDAHVREVVRVVRGLLSRVDHAANAGAQKTFPALRHVALRRVALRCVELHCVALHASLAHQSHASARAERGIEYTKLALRYLVASTCVASLA
eukprot:gene14045-biopygen4880